MAALSAAKKVQHAAIIDDVAAVIKDGDGELVLSQVLPNVFHRIEFWRVGRQGQSGDVVWCPETCCGVVSSAVESEDGLRFACDFLNASALALGRAAAPRAGHTAPKI